MTDGEVPERFLTPMGSFAELESFKTAKSGESWTDYGGFFTIPRPHSIEEESKSGFDVGSLS